MLVCFFATAKILRKGNTVPWAVPGYAARRAAAYSASKAGMNAFARALALEVDRDGINVHIVTPGPVETEMLQDVPFEMHAITVGDVAEAVAWLDTVQTSVDLPEIRLNAITRGPSARPPIVPLEVQRRAVNT